MDHRTFDRLTHLFAASGSRRTAWRALLAAALVGATSRSMMAAPTNPCTKGKHKLCGRECCPGKCFMDERCEDSVVCCTEPNFVVCENPETGKARCCQNTGRGDPCASCNAPVPPSGTFCPGGIAGSCRRR
jgi:hypothetical protein